MPVTPSAASPRQTSSPVPDSLVQQRPHICCHACLFGQVAPDGVTQGNLLVGEFQIHSCLLLIAAAVLAPASP